MGIWVELLTNKSLRVKMAAWEGVFGEVLADEHLAGNLAGQIP